VLQTRLRLRKSGGRTRGLWIVFVGSAAAGAKMEGVTMSPLTRARARAQASKQVRGSARCGQRGRGQSRQQPRSWRLLSMDWAYNLAVRPIRAVARLGARGGRDSHTPPLTRPHVPRPGRGACTGAARRRQRQARPLGGAAVLAAGPAQRDPGALLGQGGRGLARGREGVGGWGGKGGGRRVWQSRPSVEWGVSAR
jgi:hypothetical protein